MPDDPPRDLLDAPARDPAGDGDNVIEFRKREPQDGDRLDALARAPRHGASCTHRRRRYVDDKQRRVTCGECGETLDPIWCLLTLIEFREHLAHERAWIEGEKRAAERRRAAAMARRQRATAAVVSAALRRDCRRCDGTGWAPRAGGGVVRCGCRTAGAKLV